MKRPLLVLVALALVAGGVMVWRANRAPAPAAKSRKPAPLPRAPLLRAPRDTIDAGAFDAAHGAETAAPETGNSAIAGRLNRGGVASSGQVHLALGERPLRELDVGDDGEYRVENLPAGRYTVSAAPVRLGAQVHVPPQQTSLVVEPGKTAFADFDFPATVAAVVRIDPGPDAIESASHFIVRGELINGRPGPDTAFVTFGSGPTAKPIVQSNLDPGVYTVCISAEGTETPATSCVPFELSPSPAEQLFTVRF